MVEKLICEKKGKEKKWQERLREYVDEVSPFELRRDLKEHRIEVRKNKGKS